MAGRKKREGPELFDVNVRLAKAQLDYITQIGKARGIMNDWNRTGAGVDRSATLRQVIDEHMNLICEKMSG